MRTLKDLKPGEKGTVRRIAADPALRRRLIEMGITQGSELTVRKYAPLGDPIEVSVRGCELAFRLNEAEKIQLVG
ncbi:FeoA family protein [Gehongia tenuis]|uniref:Ferrous iron transport protein A n=1 Tax=Gehongia tenuis TaxID=2763655 RepID=A0A926HQD0_9FIRM|nr:FeoA family protein [Gehongia tenuis]MBC8531126.1 ferrous iron transport protein A [Gehongia tenuis]